MDAKKNTYEQDPEYISLMKELRTLEDKLEKSVSMDQAYLDTDVTSEAAAIQMLHSAGGERIPLKPE